VKIDGKTLLLGGLVVAVVAGVSRRASAASSGGAKVKLPQPTRQGREDIRAIGERIGLSENWIRFLEATAKNESNFNNLASRGDPKLQPGWASSMNKDLSDAGDARRQYDDARKTWLKGCGWSAGRYGFGSGGWFAHYPVYAVRAFKGTELACLDPWAIFDPEASVVMALAHLRRTMNRDAFQADPTWVNLRIGWGNPSKMGDPDVIEKSLTQPKKFADRLAQLGYDPSMAELRVDPLPNLPEWDELLRQLKGGSIGAHKRTRGRRGRGGRGGMGVAA